MTHSTRRSVVALGPQFKSVAADLTQVSVARRQKTSNAESFSRSLSFVRKLVFSRLSNEAQEEVLGLLIGYLKDQKAESSRVYEELMNKRIGALIRLAYSN